MRTAILLLGRACLIGEMDRADVLSEIRRSSREHSGKAPGRARFEAETGIGYGVWGRFWARWGDALKEAGMQPNEMNQPYRPEDLAEAFVSLAQELGHLPSRAELRVKAAAMESFPSPNTFSRLGATKAEVVSSIRQFCLSRPGLEDVLAMCGRARVFPRNQANKVPSKGDSSGSLPLTTGFVYLLKSGKFYKIGRSNSVGRRQYELSIQLPERPSLIHEIETDDPAGIETYWHQRFTSKRKSGEWFDLSREDVQAFRKRKFM